MYYSHIDPDKFDESQKQGEKILFRNSHYDPATDKTTRLKLPPEHAVIAVSPDGQTFVTKTTEFGTFKQSVYLTPLKTMKPELLDQSGSMTLHMVAFSPDGRRILLRKLSPKTLTLTAIDMKTKEETEIIGSIDAGAGMMQDFCWSPDSKRIAYHWHEEIPQPAGVPIPVVPGVKWNASRVTVCDLDGSNSKVIVKREYNETITAIDWK